MIRIRYKRPGRDRGTTGQAGRPLAIALTRGYLDFGSGPSYSHSDVGLDIKPS
ncbi:MAG TPA: hypothetical protein VEZ50_11625 [Nodosilinea sp.]|nr:hypothetical protein [Nodosilinea sp.]